MKYVIAAIGALLKILFTVVVVNVIVFILLIAVIVEWFKDKKWVRFPCDKDPTKHCPYKASIKITGAGVMSCSSDTIFKCCKGEKDLQYLKQIRDNHVRKNK